MLLGKNELVLLRDKEEDLKIMIDTDEINFEIKKINYKIFSIVFEIEDFDDSSKWNSGRASFNKWNYYV